jgi:hypothetical protein
VIGDDPIVFFRHPAVERTKACLDVDKGDSPRVRGKSAGRHRIRVTLDDDSSGLQRAEEFIKRCGSIPYLCATGLPTDTDVGVRLAHRELREEVGRKCGVVVLTGVYDMCVVAEKLSDTCKFDDFGSSSEDYRDRSTLRLR